MGDKGGNYHVWSPSPGTYKITAIAYSRANAGGSELSRATFTLTVESQSQTTTTPTPIVNSTSIPTPKVTPTPKPASTPTLNPPSSPPSNPPVGELPRVYAMQCVACHGVNGSGGFGGKLTNYSKGHSLTQMTNVIRRGHSGNPPMPAYPASAVSDADIKLIYAFFGNTTSTVTPAPGPAATPTPMPTSRPTRDACSQCFTCGICSSMCGMSWCEWKRWTWRCFAKLHENISANDYGHSPG